MRITNLRIEDTERIYPLFTASSLSAEEARARNPASGFFEYHLSEGDIVARLQDPTFSFCLERQGKILAYIIAYPISFLTTTLIPRSPEDPIFNKLQKAHPRAVYFDQLWLNPGLPAFVLGRFIDTFEDVVKSEKSPGLLAAIPQYPWKNRSSTSLATYRGLE